MIIILLHKSTVQAALDKLRSETELQWQSRYEQTTEELKVLAIYYHAV